MSEYTHIVPFKYGHAHKFLCLRNDLWNSAFIERNGEYSEDEVDVFRTFVQPDSVVVDGGALFGAHTVALASLVPDAVVLAFEPQRIPFQILCGNLQLNSLDNVIAYEAALSDGNGHVTIPDLNPRNGPHYGLTEIDKPATTERNHVRCDKLDSFVNASAGIDFIKLDIEGSELRALRGAERTISMHHPTLYLEFQSHEEEIKRLLKAWGYECWLHYARPEREPNYNGSPMPDHASAVKMLLAVHPSRARALNHLDLVEVG